MKMEILGLVLMLTFNAQATGNTQAAQSDTAQSDTAQSDTAQSDTAHAPAIRTEIPNEFVASLPANTNFARLHRMGFTVEKNLTPHASQVSLLHLKLSPVIQHVQLAEITEKLGANWVQPNYRYEGDLYDRIGVNVKRVPEDPSLSDQYHHLAMKNVEAWDLEMGQAQIIVAVTDDGFEMDHEDLANSFYVNPNEIPNNGIDDDHNGYVDDVRGWDMIDNDNVTEPSGDHGTHVAGIVAATANNNTGIVGTASGVKLMPLKIFSGYWTSAIVAGAFTYAADNGARIITTSYNIDGMVDDQAYREAVKYAYDKGLLLFNSAGNSAIENPTRTEVNELVLICSTIADQVNDDLKSDFSNYGSKIHLCAPGGGGRAGILSTLLANTYGRMSGTSMASPNAAAAAALIWSHYPDWTRDQVLARLLASADSIDAKNPRYAGKLGAGRVNTFRALAE